jgi:hypothetical protein
MNLNKLESTNDLTVKEFRDLAKTLRSFRDVKEDVILNAFKQNSQINPSEMFDFFIENGLLEKGILTEQQEQTWSATLPLRAIAGASLQKRKTSDKAWDEVAKAFARIVCLSDNLPWVIHSPSKLFLFGSMLDPNKKDYGDADLAITFNKREDIEILLDKQYEWLEHYQDFISSKLNTSMGFEDQAQLKQDISAGSSFISINTNRDIEYLSSEPENIGKFPVMVLWQNKNLPSIKDENESLALANLWMETNPEAYLEIQTRLNQALSKLGIVPYTEPDFEQSCKDYMKNALTEELVKKLPSVKKFGEDSTLVNRMVRMGSVGFEAIGRAVTQVGDFNQELSKLDTLFSCMTEKDEKNLVKGYNFKKIIPKTKKKKLI